MCAYYIYSHVFIGSLYRLYWFLSDPYNHLPVDLSLVTTNYLLLFVYSHGPSTDTYALYIPEWNSTLVTKFLNRRICFGREDLFFVFIIWISTLLEKFDLYTILYNGPHFASSLSCRLEPQNTSTASSGEGQDLHHSTNECMTLNCMWRRGSSLRVWGMWRTPSLLLLSCLLWPSVIGSLIHWSNKTVQFFARKYKY